MYSGFLYHTLALGGHDHWPPVMNLSYIYAFVCVTGIPQRYLRPVESTFPRLLGLSNSVPLSNIAVIVLIVHQPKNIFRPMRPEVMENAMIHCMSSNRCPVGTTPTEKLGGYLVTGYPIRSHEDYARAYRQSDAAALNANGIKNVNNALWSIPGLNPPDLVRADILHNILLGMLDHLMSWIQGFLE